ncbi:MAG: hypothetical protein KC546_00115 [Anaerolineae bacterium]|nr:hypothetical protein [Anaerolineae bacterium]MCA9886733.1 hypothetical protein [Anaerolineae bacterium]MCA9891358.1 hypothetical protein [Anaerolineae bacterium]
MIFRISQVVSFFFVFIFSVGVLLAHDSAPTGGPVTDEPSKEQQAAQTGTLASPLTYAPLLIAGLMATAATGALWMAKQSKYNWVFYAITFLLSAASVIHILLGLEGDMLLLLNGIGYSVLLGARFLPMASKHPYYVVMSGITVVYTLVTIVGYILMHDRLDIVGSATKAIEVALVSLLTLQLVGSRSLESTIT